MVVVYVKIMEIEVLEWNCLFWRNSYKIKQIALRPARPYGVEHHGN